MDSESGKLKLHPSLFLLLLILGKLYPSPMDGAYSALSMAPFIPFILNSRYSFGIRESSACSPYFTTAPG
ncbi:UNVERIFIED_CONTAM: hypothetical protein K2H54_045735 [Gekko kuhli]